MFERNSISTIVKLAKISIFTRMIKLCEIRMIEIMAHRLSIKFIYLLFLTGLLLFTSIYTNQIQSKQNLHETTKELIWSKVDTVNPPSPRYSSSFVFDNENNISYLFGGAEGYLANFNDTWSFDYSTSTWNNLEPIDFPHSRFEAETAISSKASKILLFGGNNYTSLSDTWMYDIDNNLWSEINSPDSPSSRFGSSMIYDEKYEKFILYGGYNGITNDYLNDTWEFDLTTNTWTELFPTESAGLRVGHEMSYNPISEQIYLFGGQIDDVLDEVVDVWVFDYEAMTWNEIETTEQPQGRDAFGLIFDIQEQIYILNAGFGVDFSKLQDTWVFDPATSTWEEIESEGIYRRSSTFIYDSHGKVGISFGGLTGDHRTNTRLVNDVWIAEWEVTVSSSTSDNESTSTSTVAENTEDSNGSNSSFLHLGLIGFILSITAYMHRKKLSLK